ncbi:DUF6517 family protein [Halocatena salina]|uniref:DUF6517 family protein n=1 Tax=Halocatena salina TaxID=2934340 RepID=A0A8U0A032_9EURY|nr:DUF6517 family protein [Halocatena salina]UPM42471.1 DUF6517 family protein [Halocatena salina]
MVTLVVTSGTSAGNSEPSEATETRFMTMIRDSIPTSKTTITLLLVCLLATSGCLDVLTGEEPYSVESEPVDVSDDALSSTEYELARNESPTFNNSVSVADQERSVEATSHMREYERNTDLAGTEVSVTRFVVLSTPKAEIGGQSMNPIGDWSNNQLIEELLGTYEGVDTPEFDGNRTASVLGEERTVSTYTATAQVVEEVSVPVTIHVASFAHEDDYITVIAVHPDDLEEQQRIDRLLEGLEHPA